jgi:calcium-dependent protein kinase
LRLIDFGCAVQVAENKKIRDFVGSCFYVSPEVAPAIIGGEAVDHITGFEWKKADVWSIGVIIYILMTGAPPFHGEPQRTKMLPRIMKGSYSWPNCGEVAISDQCKDVIAKCLTLNTKARPTVDELLKHPWINGKDVSDAPLSVKLLNSLSMFSNQNKLRKAVGKAMANRMTDREKGDLQELFKKYDTNGDGVLSPDELANMMREVGLSGEEAKCLVNEIDEDGDGAVGMNEMKSVHALAVNDPKKMFQMFDKDGDGEVTAKEILAVCDFLTSDQVNDIMKQSDSDNDGKLSFDEWIKAMGQMKA